jgi:hypothetical protein
MQVVVARGGQGQGDDAVQLLVHGVEVGGGELQACMIFFGLGGDTTKISGLVSSG